MKLSIITTVTDPFKRQDPYIEALASYIDLADEVVVVCGRKKDAQDVRDGFLDLKEPRIKFVYLDWPSDWDFSELPKHLNAGLEAATGDWVIKADIDYIFHHNTMKELRRRLEQMSLFPVATLQKYLFVTHAKCYQKGQNPLAINKKEFPNICYGEAVNKKTDLCYPIFPKIGGVNKKGVPTGAAVPEKRWGKTGIAFYVYDNTFKTQDVVKEEFWKMSKAWHSYFGEWKWGKTKEEAFEVWIEMMRSRLNKCAYSFAPQAHPKYIQEKIKNITDEQFGFRGWGMLGEEPCA